MRFAVYSLIGWLLPALLVTIPLALQLAETESDFRPDYGKTICWINSNHALLMFVVVPLCIVMLLNACFFSWTSWLIHTTKSKTLSSSTDRTDFRLFVKLGFIMGLTWITGVVAVFWNHEAVWYVFVLLNTLQGLFILIAFTCTKKVWKELSRISQTGTSTRTTTIT